MCFQENRKSGKIMYYLGVFSMKFLKKLFGTQQTRTVKKYFRIVERINQEEEKLKSLSDSDLRQKTLEFQKRIEEGETPDDLLVEAYAVVKNACRRLVGTSIHVSGYDQKWDMIPYDVQIVGAIAMHYGSIAEMQTGEGKTLTASMPLYLHALTKKPVHLVTVNDYLATRDSEWIGTIFTWLGLSVKALTNETPLPQRKEFYKADILYGTASEFGFDYLRDNSMVHTKDQKVQRGHYFAIIDEIDSILIDEARTPLIISGPSSESRQMYDSLKTPVHALVRVQRDTCNQIASEAKRTLTNLGIMQETEEEPKLSKEDEATAKETIKKLWLVSQGNPTNKTLKRARENPDLRARLENMETYFHAEENKAEKIALLEKLHILIDERHSDYELTDLGMQEWAGESKTFTMLDLSDEYVKIDENTELSSHEKIEEKVKIREEDNLRKETSHNIRQLFRAHLLMEKDVDYIVQEGKIVIIDEHTGRPQPGRRFSDGLHQAIEAKEGLKIQKETQTYATITLQNYFRMYGRLSGMTGTAITEAKEFKEIYSIEVLEIPTYRTCQRDDANDLLYMTEREKYQAIIKEIKEVNGKGRPILIGTESVEISEKIARILKNLGLKHTVLNAKNHAYEAEIIAKAGKRGAITVATNMAGRGTDIKLEEGVSELGGLHVIGTSRHQSRRIDRQLRGRCARQGDPGSSQFFISFEDSLMRLFTANNRVTALLQRFRPEEGEPISAPILNRSIETAQKRVEQRNYTIRKHTLEFDDVMNKQRTEVYAFRKDLLEKEDIFAIAQGVLQTVANSISIPDAEDALPSQDDLQKYQERLMEYFPITGKEEIFNNTDNWTFPEMQRQISKQILESFLEKCRHEASIIGTVQKMHQQKIDPMPVLYNVIRSLMIQSVDLYWQRHLLAIDHLGTEVSLQTVAQKDPLIEFKQQAFELFTQFSQKIYGDTSRKLFSFHMMMPDSPELKKILSQIDILGVSQDVQKAINL